MGWGNCGPGRDGRLMGYAVEATCDWPGCSVEIDRGLSYLCGEMHQDGESCNGYFCEDHRRFAPAPLKQQLCLECYAWALMIHWCDQCEDECEGDEFHEVAETPNQARQP